MRVGESDRRYAPAEPQGVVQLVDCFFLSALQVFRRGVEVVVLSVVHQQIRELFVVSRSKNRFIFEASEEALPLLRLELDRLDRRDLVRLGGSSEEVGPGQRLLFELLVAYFEEVFRVAAVRLLRLDVEVDVSNPLAELVQSDLFFLPGDLPDEVFFLVGSCFYCFRTIKSCERISGADFRGVVLGHRHVGLLGLHGCGLLVFHRNYYLNVLNLLSGNFGQNVLAVRI